MQPWGCKQHRWSHGWYCIAAAVWWATPAGAGMPGGAVAPRCRGWPSARVCPRGRPVVQQQ
eukprot:9207032-Alexandrium_andersonii.AAC.1